MEEQVRKKACVQEIQNFFFLRSVQGHRNQYEFKQVDGVSVNGLASDFGVCICTHDAGIPQVLKYKFNCAEEVNVE